jgi:uncharacterized membrane protein YhaH (DUF805 family)
MSIDPGWYPAEGDLPNTIQSWDGELWIGDPDPIARPAVEVMPPPPGRSSRALPPRTPDPKLSPWGYYKRTVLERNTGLERRARRAEYSWIYVCYMATAMAGIGIFIGALAISEILAIVVGIPLWLALLWLVVAGWAVTFRRLHDINLIGWFFLVIMISYASAVFGLSKIFVDSKPQSNYWGRSPKYG